MWHTLNAGRKLNEFKTQTFPVCSEFLRWNTTISTTTIVQLLLLHLCV